MRTFEENADIMATKDFEFHCYSLLVEAQPRHIDISKIDTIEVGVVKSESLLLAYLFTKKRSMFCNVDKLGSCSQSPNFVSAINMTSSPSTS